MSLSKEIQDFVANYDAAEKNAITKEHNANISKYYEEQAKSKKALSEAQAAYYNSKAASEPSTIFSNNRFLPGEGPTAVEPPTTPIATNPIVSPNPIVAHNPVVEPPNVGVPITSYPTTYDNSEDVDDAYLGGGTVRPTAGPSRPDRVAQAQPGVGIPEASHGTMPGGNTTAAIASSPGYSEGAPVTPQAAPAEADDAHPMLNGLDEAINAGAKFIHDRFGLDQTNKQAVPSSDHATNLRRFHSGEGAASADDHSAITKAVDPNNQLKESLRDAAGLNAVYQHYVSRGEYNKASQTAGALLLHLRNVSSQYGSQAVNAIKNGDLQGGLDNTKKAFDKVPNGTSLEGNVNQDGTVNVAEKDHAGRTVTQSRLTPQQLLSAATGLKNGTGYFQVLQAAAGKKGGNGAAGATSAGKLPSAEQNAAFKEWVQNGGTTEPPIASLHKSHINPALSLYRVRMKNEGGSGAGASGGALKVEKRSDLDDDMTKALGDYNESLPKDVKLTESHMAPLQSAATHIVTGTGLGPKEAFRAADDLSDPTNPAIDKGVPMKNGAIAVRLRSGTTLPLTEDAFNHVMAYRKQRIHEDSIKAGEFGKKQEQALKVNDDWQTIKEAVGGLSDSTKNWMQKQWADYQASKGAQ